MGMWLRLSFLVVCQSRYCTTTPKLLLPVFWVMANANEHGCSQNWYPIICLRIGLAVLVRATIRAWWAIPAATSWYPNPGSPVLMISMSICCLLYTSDAADDLTRVDLGGRRIIKKK